jgi:hypothetical protein
MNSTCPHLPDGHYPCLAELGFPFYHTDRPSLVPPLLDTHLAIVAPVIAYWVYSLFFHCLDISGWQWLEKYRIHDSAEVQSKNRVSRSSVVWAVLVQQTIQTVLGLLTLHHENAIDHGDRLISVTTIFVKVVILVCGKKLGGLLLQRIGSKLAYFVYWWAIPAAQLAFAMYAHIIFSIAVSPNGVSQVFYRYLAVFPSPATAHQQISLQTSPFSSSSPLRALCIWCALQPSDGRPFTGHPWRTHCAIFVFHDYTPGGFLVYNLHTQNSRRPLWLQAAFRPFSIFFGKLCRLS